MKKAVAVGAVCSFALMAGAKCAEAESFFQIEGGAGVGEYTREGPGIYYSPPFAAKVPVTAFAFRAGIVLTPIIAAPHSWVPGLRIHGDYLNFGAISWSAQSPEDSIDPAFAVAHLPGGYQNKGSGCINNNCGQMSDFESFGRIQAIGLTLEPYWNFGSGWTIGVEAGPAIYRDTWVTHATVETSYGINELGPVGTVHTLTTQPKLHVGALVGASISKGPFSVRYNYIFARKASTGNLDNQSMSGVNGAHMLTLNYTF